MTCLSCHRQFTPQRWPDVCSAWCRMRIATARLRAADRRLGTDWVEHTGRAYRYRVRRPQP